MAAPKLSMKRVALDKANAQMVVIVVVATFVTVFSLFGAKAAISQNRYQARVTSAKQKAHAQLQKNLKNFDALAVSYKAFDNTATNVIGGNAKGSGDNDGTNSKIILDALPSTYDFPALTASIEKILGDRGLSVSSITGTDDQLNQQGNLSSPTPQPVEMPFSFTVTNADYASINRLVSALQNSIRPIQIDTLELNGGANNMTLTVDAHTYYQPAKNVSITKKAVK